MAVAVELMPAKSHPRIVDCACTELATAKLTEKSRAADSLARKWCMAYRAGGSERDRLQEWEFSATKQAAFRGEFVTIGGETVFDRIVRMNKIQTPAFWKFCSFCLNPTDQSFDRIDGKKRDFPTGESR